jgi:hypothetical protein
MKKKIIITTFIITGVLLSGCVRPETGISTEMVSARKDKLLRRFDKTKRMYKKTENREIKIVSYFHRRKIGEAVVEKDFIRYQFNTETGELIEQKKQWRSGLLEKVKPSISRKKAEAMVEGEVLFSKLYIISPDSDVFTVKPTPKNPCWVVRSVEGERMIVTIIDAITGEKLGYGVPPPHKGLSIHGPDWGACPQDAIWYNHAENARIWFTAMGYKTERVGNASDAKVQSNIQSDDTAMFYELDHGGSTSFHNQCASSITANEVETWITAYASMPFTFLGSCEGMCDQSDNRFSYEFRKGSNDGTVAVGYCGMSGAQCDDCWPDAIDWQTTLFSWMASGNTVGYAFSRANLAFPDCAGTNNCMRIGGDTALRVVPVLTRSLCGSVYNGYKGPLSLNSRDHYIRCDITVPTGQALTIDPHVEVIFLNNSKVTSHGTLNANGNIGQVRLVSEEDNNKGIELTGQIRITNGGQIKIYE